MTTSLAGRMLLADAFHAPECGALEVLAQALIEIGGDGHIVRLTRPGEAGYTDALERAEGEDRLTRMPPGHYLLPGFVDTHVHAPQYPQLGAALDVPLEVWLQRYTFPLEARYADLAFAGEVYGRLVDDLLSSGTTTALYFATIHQEATRLLVDLCLEKGQRALIGKVAMDHPENCPDFYRDASPEAAIEGTRALIDYIGTHPGNGEGRVLPVITPRFIPACTDAALEGLGRLAAECGCHVQTHCSESDWAHGYVLARYGISDAASLDRFGLMTRRTILAHANFLDEEDMDRVKARGSGIAHCPLSNAYFADSIFPLRRALEKGLHVGLGTDISGGPSGFMPEAARGAVLVSRILESGADPVRSRAERASGASTRIDFREAFHLVTAGGGQALDLPIGLFRPGYAFDAVLIDTTADKGGIRLFGEEDGETILQKIVYGAARANIARVWVDGLAVA
ncbi:guanine deaminase [Xaviernesmea oryzae]|uniref:Guanine deaminase n=1 Tax=Xaviernesmea oryzae TaxID=464029 RepID=A0A1Q9AXQ3_9HYPH|nr:guanine deaminase [Xaviernesmea oryzae]OLP60252.1 guanine deaminase [Xaviernesmea oryzae]SEK26302.1 guanine deaminase [Xaviernesmea oryzae]